MSARVCPITKQALKPGQYVSDEAARKLRTAMRDLPALMEEFETTITKQVRMAERTHTRGNSSPLPFNPVASSAAWTARTTLLIWADHYAHKRNQPTPATWTAIATKLTEWAQWITTQPTAPRAIDEILDTIRLTHHTIDRPPDRQYTGPCPTCGGDNTAPPKTTTTRCHYCGTHINIPDRRDWMLAQLPDLILTASETAQAVTTLTGIPTDQTDINNWRTRGRLTPRDRNHHQQHRYLVRDAMNLATHYDNKRRERAQQRRNQNKTA